MIKEQKSRFIALDGPDGCGKSTQTTLLGDYLTGQGCSVSVFRDPGSTKTGEKIRQILLDPQNHICDRTELLLYMASRAQLWNESIKDALENGDCVLVDRWLSSTCAYQGFAGGIGIEKVLDIAAHSLERIWPDLTIILDIDPETAKKRIDRSLDRMEQKDDEYHKKVRQGFLSLSKFSGNILVIDASANIETVNKKIIEIVESYFD
ncbi:MAG: dTMP kinase [Sedimentisphaerales bacterium]|nr:dTMP kinase [Sedimentisphaerales bacterium]